MGRWVRVGETRRSITRLPITHHLRPATGLASLVDQSLLVQAAAGRTGASRASRCWRRSASSGWSGWRRAARRTTIRRRHAACCLALAERAEPAFDRSDRGTSGPAGPAGGRARQPAGGAGLAGRDRATPSGAPPAGGALARFWYFRGHRAEGRAWLERALARGAEAPTARPGDGPARRRHAGPPGAATTSGR